MSKHYVTFGQSHIHRIADKTLDKNTVAVYNVATKDEGRTKAFELFGDKFFTDYHDKEWKEDNISYFPSGYVDLDKPCDHYFSPSGGKYSAQHQITCQFCNETRYN